MMPQFGDAARIAPPFRLVMTYYVTSLTFFLTAVFLTLINSSDFESFYFQPHILAITHVAALGWITMIISGAMFQLIPVTFHVRIFSVHLAYIQYFLLTAGVIGFAYDFYVFDISRAFVVFASMAFVAVFLFALNILVTLLRTKDHNITWYHFVTAMVFLLTAVSIGLTLALNLRFEFLTVNHLETLKAHAHLAIVGFVTMVIFGTVYQIVPMFSLAYEFPKTPGWIAYCLTTAGLVVYAGAIVFGDNVGIALIGSVSMVLGIFSFLLQSALIFRSRVRRKLDAGLKQTVVSLGFLGLAAAVVLLDVVVPLPWISPETLALVVAFLVFYGYIGSLVQGQMLKIGPFLIWLHKYSDKVGISEVPTLHDMVDQRLAYTQLYVWSLAVPLAAAGIAAGNGPVIFTGCLAMFVSAVIFGIVQFKIFDR